MTHLILVRHGQSIWNEKNIFTGWVDIPLSKKGIAEAQKAGELLANTPIDIAFTSTLSRAITTALIILAYHNGGKTPCLIHPDELFLKGKDTIFDQEEEKRILPILQSAALNERMYGELQGKNKDAMRAHYGKEQVETWRRSFRAAPPRGESLEMTKARTLPFFFDTILPALQEGKNLLVSAHGNSLRSIIMELDQLSEEAVISLEIPTGVPLIYELQGTRLTKKL